ncbi:MAG TPA: sensor histidine kinase [Dinghuibacter sp.]|uniref:sensor histidine kinase n=1 Tax=Dinghuibacter sp. TaxID=2024697 RepID=UPI002BEE4C53|nr:sensor histidine kinase [Dinghuibacter sp.]HTJ11191.1 sensor histidine kinase [Dinghuibacter sp.]
MKKLATQGTKKLAAQLLGWVIFFFLWERLVYFYVSDEGNRWLFTAYDTGAIVLSFYALYAWVTPRLFHHRSRWRFALAFVVSVGVAGGIMYGVMQILLREMVAPVHFSFNWTYDAMQRNRFFIAFLGAATGVVVRLAMGWMQARREKVATELTYLRAQINPHFLFNSLNTIYVQMAMPGVDARETLSTFSDMLRYQLYECTSELVPLEREIAYLNNYMQLQRLRKDERYEITWEQSGEATEKKVAPFLLIPFVENMFKHVSNRPEGGNLISGRLTLAPGKLHFEGTNTRSAAGGGTGGGGKETGGIGLANVRRRLDLLYPGRHKLTIMDEPEMYTVCLDLHL